MFNRMEGGRSMLTIRNIRQSDGGSYTCKASNKAGSQERELFLKVFGKNNGKCWNGVDYLVGNQWLLYFSLAFSLYYLKQILELHGMNVCISFLQTGIIMLTDKIVSVLQLLTVPVSLAPLGKERV